MQIYDELYASPSCRLHIACFILPDQWYWRDKWLGCPPGIWQGPYPTRAAVMHAAGIAAVPLEVVAK